MLCLRVLQTALVYVNTLMVQDVLADDAWSTALTNEDRRALTPLFRADPTVLGTRSPLRRDQTRHAQPTDTEHTQRLTHRAFGSGDTFLTSTSPRGFTLTERSLAGTHRISIGDGGFAGGFAVAPGAVSASSSRAPAIVVYLLAAA